MVLAVAWTAALGEWAPPARASGSGMAPNRVRFGGWLGWEPVHHPTRRRPGMRHSYRAAAAKVHLADTDPDIGTCNNAYTYATVPIAMVGPNVHQRSLNQNQVTHLTVWQS
jgi:hypothetical protein